MDSLYETLSDFFYLGAKKRDHAYLQNPTFIQMFFERTTRDVVFSFILFCFHDFIHRLRKIYCPGHFVSLTKR
jgi:hypothetical protein